MRVIDSSFGLQKDEAAHLHQFILHASLDIVQDVVWNTNNMYVFITILIIPLRMSKIFS